MNKSSITEQRSTQAKHSRTLRRCFGPQVTGLLLSFVAASVIACDSNTPPAPHSDEDGGRDSPKAPPADDVPVEFSTAELMLRATDGVYLNQFSFQLKSPIGDIINERSISVPGEGSQTKLALELPVADDYSIIISGQGTIGANTYPCAGEAVFDVHKDELTNVDLDIECVVPVSERPETGGVEITATVVTVAPFVGECGIDGAIIGPLTVLPGSFITAQGTAVPTTSTFAWTAGEGLYGTFTDPSAGNDVLTRFRCFGGSGNIVLTVTSDLCTDQYSVLVSCGPAGVCGDGIIQTFRGEVCDDGNTADDDDCNSVCVPTICGDGTVDQAEDCDDGNTANDDGCSSTCGTEECGDGNKQASEECDDGNSDDADECTNACTIPAFCGDGNTQSGEQCDDGNQVNVDACANDCTANSCGDGVVQTEFGEQCDDANTADNDGCSLCTFEFCGDGVLQDASGELCDDGNTLSGDGCNAGCFTEYCGDGVVQPGIGEQCDSSSGCSAECTYLAVCGDTEVNPGETCDDGDTIDGDGCSATCASESCGDGALQITLGEDCDDGNTLNGDGCTSMCVRELCGDATLNAGESCDDGNTTAGDGCSETCQFEHCGNGSLQPANDEDCDDGNTASGDGCSSTCHFENAADAGSDAGFADAG